MASVADASLSRRSRRPLAPARPASVTSRTDLAALVTLNHAKGAAAHSGPYPMVGGTGPAGPVMRGPGIDTSVLVEGREPGVAAVDQPKVTDGTWIRPGGVVVERSFAQAANLRLGQTITLDGRPFQVAGFAVTAAFHGFPAWPPPCLPQPVASPAGRREIGEDGCGHRDQPARAAGAAGS